jgi:hypothetical protein
LHSQDFLEESVNEAVSPEVHRMVNKFVTGMADKYDYSLQDAVYAIIDVLKSQKYKGLKESVNEGLLKLDEGAVKQFEIDYKGMETSIKRGIGWIDPEYVAETWENSSDTIDYEIVRNEILTRLIKADLLYTSLDGETKGKRITNISQIK